MGRIAHHELTQRDLPPRALRTGLLVWLETAEVAHSSEQHQQLELCVLQDSLTYVPAHVYPNQNPLLQAETLAVLITGIS